MVWSCLINAVAVFVLDSPQPVPIKVNGNFLLHLQAMKKAWSLHVCFYNLLGILKLGTVLPTTVRVYANAHRHTHTHN